MMSYQFGSAVSILATISMLLNMIHKAGATSAKRIVGNVQGVSHA